MVSVSICGIRGRNILVAHGPFHAQHPTFHIQHLTPIISHPTLHTQHSQHPFPPAKYLCLSSAPAAQSVLLTSTPHGFCVDLWHLREKYSCAAWHIPHSAAPHAKDTFHILNTPPPNLHGFFPLRPAPHPNTPFSAHHCNRLTTSHLLSKPSRATFQTHHSPPRNAIFRPTISALSKLHPLPFAPRSLSPRNPIHAQRPRHPPFTAFPPVPNSPPNPSNRAFPPSVSPKIPTPLFHQKSLPSALSPHCLYDSVECNGVSEEWPCAFPMLIHRRPSCRLEKFLVPLMVSSIQSSTFNRSFLQNLLISNRWFSTVCLSLLTLMYP